MLGIEDLGLDELEGLEGMAIPAMTDLADMAWVPQVQQSAWGQAPGVPAIKQEAEQVREPETQYLRKSPQGVANDTPPASNAAQDVSPDFAMPSSPEQNSSDDDASGCLTPPKVPYAAGTKVAPATGRSASKKRKGVPVSVKTEVLPAAAPAAAPTTAPQPDATASAAEMEPEVDIAAGAMSYDPKVLEDNRATRLKRNREAAQQFRKRKKEYVIAVERDAERLRAENMELRARLSAAETENGVLREENAFYRNLVNGRSNLTMPGAVAVSASASGPAAKVAKVAAGTMCAMMMVIGVAQIGGQPMQKQAAGVSTDVMGQQIELSWDAPQASRRRRMEDASSSGNEPALPLPGSLWDESQRNVSIRPWNASASVTRLGYNFSAEAANQSHKWLSLMQPYTGDSGSYDGAPSRYADVLQRSFLHRGFLSQDGATGELAMVLFAVDNRNQTEFYQVVF